MITCIDCGGTKTDKEFKTGKHNNVLGALCKYCRETPREVRDELQRKVAASTISKMAGTYTPPAWNIRIGADEFLSIKSRWA